MKPAGKPEKHNELQSWFESELLAWDQINDKLTRHTGYNFYDYSLSEYFQYDKWKISEAWLLLAGINPKASLIDWNHIVESHEGAPLGRIKIEIANPIKFNPVCEHPLEALREGEFGLDSEGIKSWNEQAKKHAFVIEHYRCKLEKIVNVWERSLHPDPSLTSHSLSIDEYKDRLVNKDYVIHWALSKRLDIVWLDWAKSRGHVGNNETQTKAPCSPDRLNLDPALQTQAESVAASFFAEKGRRPTKSDVAQIIIKEASTHLDLETVVRRIRATWKKKDNK